MCVVLFLWVVSGFLSDVWICRCGVWKNELCCEWVWIVVGVYW